MGTEYYLFNHQNATVFELGKGPWYLIEDLGILHTASHFVTWLSENWGHSATSIEYHKVLAKALKDFTENTPEGYLEITGDSSEDLGWAGNLGYICTGSRYGLGNKGGNKEYVDHANEYMIGDGVDSPLTEQDVEKLMAEGWNFKNYGQKVP